jgi:iron complex outermembrane receptor protein
MMNDHHVFVDSRRAQLSRLASVSALALMAATAPAMAQETAPAPQPPRSASQSSGSTLQEIVVTARKREESLMRTPVITQALPRETVQRLHIDSTYALSNVIPTLKINTGFALNGVTINFRGLGNGGAANLVEQSMALNLDGFTTSSGQFYRAGLFDVGQIEVLKGPQALFFGKSSSAGVISIRSANPTSEWETAITTGYEFTAREKDLDAYISGPITDTLGVRLAAYRNSMDGWLRNPNPAALQRLPNDTNVGGRLTLKYDSPDHTLRINAKGSITKDSGDYWVGDTNQTICQPGGNPIFPYKFYDNCRVDKTTRGDNPSLPYTPGVNFSNPFNPAPFAVGMPSSLFGDGPHTFTNAQLGTINLDWDFAPNLTLTSVTGIAYVHTESAGTSGSIIVPIQEFGVAFGDKKNEFSQEIRVTSNWKDSWFNFMLGGLYNPLHESTRSAVVVPQPTAFPFPAAIYTDNSVSMRANTYSAFGQAIITPIEQIEFDAGLRYIEVEKRITSYFASNNEGSFGAQSGELIQNLSDPKIHIDEKKWLPEFTLNYKPTSDLTAFISYKHGYKGPGFNATTTLTHVNDSTFDGAFPGEKVKGFEGGVKAQLLDRQLALTLTGYHYDYSDLQVAIPNAQTNQLVFARGVNARVQGVEGGVNYGPRSIPGLTLNFYVNYNDSHYTNYPNSTCYTGQPISEGCVYLPSGAAIQDLTGRTLHLAPKWSGNFGGEYEWDVANDYSASFNASADFSSSYLVSPELNPIGLQDSYIEFNTALRFKKKDGSWEIAALCRNCTNQFVIVNGADLGDGVLNVRKGGVNVNVGRNREVLLQLTLRPTAMLKH